jgi:hypothetical protein
MKINDLITELQAFAEEYGNVDMHFGIHADNTRNDGELAKAVINAYGNNVYGGNQARMDFVLEEGSKITTSKELKEKRNSGVHIWSTSKFEDFVNDSSFERRTGRFGNPNNKWSTMTEDNC